MAVGDNSYFDFSDSAPRRTRTRAHCALDLFICRAADRGRLTYAVPRRP